MAYEKPAYHFKTEPVYNSGKGVNILSLFQIWKLIPGNHLVVLRLKNNNVYQTVAMETAAEGCPGMWRFYNVLQIYSVQKDVVEIKIEWSGK